MPFFGFINNAYRKKEFLSYQAFPTNHLLLEHQTLCIQHYHEVFISYTSERRSEEIPPDSQLYVSFRLIRIRPIIFVPAHVVRLVSFFSGRFANQQSGCIHFNHRNGSRFIVLCFQGRRFPPRETDGHGLAALFFTDDRLFVYHRIHVAAGHQLPERLCLIGSIGRRFGLSDR